MVRGEMLARMSSMELTGWWALWELKQDETERAEERRKDLAESGDGVVFEHNRDPEEDEDDDGRAPD